MMANTTGERLMQPFGPYVQVFTDLYFPTIISFLYHVEITVKTNLDLWTVSILAIIVNVVKTWTGVQFRSRVLFFGGEKVLLYTVWENFPVP